MSQEPRYQALEKFIQYSKESDRLMGGCSITENNSLNQQELLKHAENSLALINRIITAIDSDIAADSPQAQALIQEDFAISNAIAPMSKERYLSSRECLKEDGPMYKYYAQLHPKMPDFFYTAMGIFAAHTFPV